MKDPPNRRRFLTAAIAGTTTGLAGCSVQPPIDEDEDESEPTEPVGEGDDRCGSYRTR